MNRVVITDADYQAIASEIKEKISGNYFAGKFEIENSADDATLCFDGRIYFHAEYSYEDWGLDCSVTSAQPVWVECHSTIEDGEVINDFEFSKLVNYLID